MILTKNSIRIRAPEDLIYGIACDVARWPYILSHYRFVQILREEKARNEEVRHLKMGASRSHIPVSWTAIQRLFPDEKRIEYHHVGGVTRGMDVIWYLTTTRQVVEVTIEHELESPIWWMRTRLASQVVGKTFIMNIADKTLRGIKIEAERRAKGFSTP